MAPCISRTSEIIWGSVYGENMMMNHNHYYETWSTVKGNTMKNEGKWRIKFLEQSVYRTLYELVFSPHFQNHGAAWRRASKEVRAAC